MRIISDFHDYYDIGMQNGIDPQLPYRRFRREEHRWVGYPFGFPQEICSVYFIGFAGKVYPTIKCQIGSDNSPKFFYDIDKIDNSFFDSLIEFDYPYDRRIYEPQQLATRKRRQLQKIFTTQWTHWLEIFESYQTAIFVHKLNSETIIINERLNLYHFQKVLPPMEAFQELAMYVGSCLTKPVIEEPPLSDKIKAEIHGFDKFSFRKEKSK